NLSHWSRYTIYLHDWSSNVSSSDLLRDLLPTGATGGMCTLTPTILSAQVFASDGITPVAGKAPLNQGTDYSLNYSPAPNYQLNRSEERRVGKECRNQRPPIH